MTIKFGIFSSMAKLKEPPPDPIVEARCQVHGVMKVRQSQVRKHCTRCVGPDSPKYDWDEVRLTRYRDANKRIADLQVALNSEQAELLAIQNGYVYT